ncbi:MAG: carboxymuconolactone decarboxylase family protein [Hyphomonadaceae bacterium]|nr:carboxymuconolactone decarboxylase family protein [Hyphomonadaceae bacterium]
MSSFPLHTIETAPEGSRQQLSDIEKTWKFIPNLHRVLAQSPETLKAYDTLFGLFAKSTLSPTEQQIAYLSIIYINECEYCMAGHSVLAGMANVPADVINAVRENLPIADRRLEALRRFAQAVTVKRGKLGDAAVAEFLGAGFTGQNVLEVVLATATKVISNYVNHIAHTPNDDFMAKTAWMAPSRRKATA